MEDLESASATKKFFADLTNYIALGSLITSSRGELDIGYTQDFKEFDYVPPSCSQISARLQLQIQDLCRKRLVRIFIRKQSNQTLHIKVYILPDDVGRSIFEQDERKTLRQPLLDLVHLLDSSREGWNGRNGENASLYDLKSKNDDSLFFIFNCLPSPTTKGLTVPCPYANTAIQEVLNSSNLQGLRTSLYPYQKRTVATMIRREVEPARTLDPRMQPLTCPTGEVFYVDVHARRILRDRREYDEACGGILGESMGLGKTLICLATILSTKGHWPSIPPEYSLGLHPIRPGVASLMETAAGAIAQSRIPWKAYFDDMLAAGEDLTKCRDMLEANVPYYKIPEASWGSAVRNPANMPQNRLVRLCSATLVIVPQNLLSQWRSEIARHVEEGELAVLYLDTSGNVPMPSTEKLQLYDIILMTRQRLEREIVPPANSKTKTCRSWDYIDRQRPYVHKLQIHPLKNLHFLRIIMDEGHEFSSYGRKNQTYWALQHLRFDRKWIVSGTPSGGLIGVEVEAAASETIGIAEGQSSSPNAAILQHRRKQIALAQERKDLQKLGGLVIDFLKQKPWANKTHDLATWAKYIIPSGDGTRKPGSLQQLLESLVVRHRIEDVEVDLKLPPLYNRVVYLKPSWYDKVSINLFALALVSNFVTSERKDEDYMFHPKNKKFLNSLITNLRQANFYWTSWTPEQVEKTIQASRAYLEDQKVSENVCSKVDCHLLQQGIDLGEIILQCKAWRALSQVHEMGIFVEDFPDKAQHAWSLTEREGTEPLISGASQVAKAQEWVDAHVGGKNAEGIKGMISYLPDLGIKVMHELWNSGHRTTNLWGMTDRKARPVNEAGVPPIIQKQTVSRVKASSKQGRLNSVFPIAKTVPGDRTSFHFKPQIQPVPNTSGTPSTAPTPLLESAFAKTKIIGTASTKLSYLLDQLVKLHTSEKILVFYEGDHVAYYIAQALELLSIRHLIYTAQLPSARQTAYITTFNSTQTFRVLLMDVHHAAHGLHIASASRVFFVNPVWQPNVEAQAIKRAHRIGQTRPVYVETLVLEGTFEDQMLGRRRGMTAAEHQKAEKCLLDDDTMSVIIKNASFTPFLEHEIQNAADRIAKLQTPQQLFDRPDRPIGNIQDRDADLIFPDGKPEKSRKRKQGSGYAPDMAAKEA